MSRVTSGTPLSLSELASKIGGELGAAIGLEGTVVKGVSSPDLATSDDCVCVSDPKHFKDAIASKSSIIVISSDLQDDFKSRFIETSEQRKIALILVDDAYVGLAKLTQYFFSPDGKFSWPLEAVDSDSEIAMGARVSKTAEIGKGCRIYPGAVISDGVSLGDNCVVFPNAVIYPGVSIGHRARIHGGVIIGSDGFGYARPKGHPVKINHTGGVIIGDDFEIGSNSCIDRGTFGDTIIGNGVKIDNLCQVGHNAEIGEGSVICGQSGISGSAKIGKFNTFGGMSGISNVKTGDGVMLAGGARVTSQNLADGSIVAGQPDRPYREWMKLNGYLSRLPEIFKRVKKLESK